MHGFVQDLRYALRTFAKSPGFAAAAILSLALGVGANSSIFSVASALLLRPLPYADPERLVILWNRSPGLGITEDWFSTAQYFDITSASQQLQQVAIAIGANSNLTGDGPPERVGTIRASSNLLPMLGARPLHGRLFTTEEDVEGAAPTAILHHGTWTRRYGSDPNAVGQSVVLNGVSYRIIGVMPASFSLRREVMPTLGIAADAEILLPLPLGPKAPQIRGREDYNILAKLKRGVSVWQAQAEMDALTARLRQEHPDVYPPNGGLTFGVVPLRDQVVGDVRWSLIVLLAAVGLVLLISCANVATLLLSRALDRQKEMAVRAALGATRSRIVRQLLTESVLLAVAGGALGLLLARWSLDGIRVLGAASVPRLHDISIDGRVLLFTLALSVAAGILFGLAPALRLGDLRLHDALKEAGRGMPGGGAFWGRGANPRRLLVAAELALAVMVLVGAGLLARSFARLQAVPPGFIPDGVLTMEVTLTGPKHPDAQAVLESYRQLWPRLAALPGVTAAGGVSALPLSGMMSWGPITVDGRVLPPGEKFINADQRMVGGDYFRAMGIPLVSGRLFSEHDTRTSDRVVIVDELMAQQFWPAGAVGKRIRLGGSDSTSPWMTVVGVVGRIKQDALDTDSRIAMYLAHTQFPTRSMNVVLKGAGDPAALAAPAVGAIQGMDPGLPVYNVRTMGQRVAESLAKRRFAVLLLTLFAALGFGIATFGVYGVIAYVVSQGARELGIRIALGATPAGIVLLIVRQGLTLATIGLSVGLVAALGAARLMRRLLFQVDATDPATFVGVAVLLTVVTVVASLVPAQRAARIDPAASLRSE